MSHLCILLIHVQLNIVINLSAYSVKHSFKQQENMCFSTAIQILQFQHIHPKCHAAIKYTEDKAKEQSTCMNQYIYMNGEKVRNINCKCDN